MIPWQDGGRLRILRDLASEVQQNHTDLQRLWKLIKESQLVWPEGIAAPPSIESDDDKYVVGVSCLGCERVPITLHMTMTRTSGGVAPGPGPGTWTLRFVDPPVSVGAGNYILNWASDCFLYGSTFYRMMLGCYSYSTLKVVGYNPYGSLETCNIVRPNSIALGYSASVVSFSCSPYYCKLVQGTEASGTIFEITE